MKRLSIGSFVLAIGMTIVVLSEGCSLFVPYVQPTVDRYEKDAQGKLTPTIGFDHARLYANSLKDEYVSAVRTQGWISGLMGPILIPLSAATLGLGITGGSAVAITALGLTAGSTYGVGSWLQSKPRQRVYLLGVAAIDCALDAFAPLGSVDPTIVSGLRAALLGADGLSEHIPKLAAEISWVEIQLDAELHKTPPPAPSDVAEVTNKISVAKDILAHARAAWTGGNQLLARIQFAGRDLAQTTDGIQRRINDAIITTEPNIQALAGLLGGVVPPKAQALTLAPSVPTPSVTKAAPLVNTADLEREASKVKSESDTVVMANSLVSPSSPNACLALAEQAGAAVALKLQPEGTVSLQAPGRVSIVVSNGAPPYGASFLSQVENLRAELRIGSGGVATVDVIADGNAKGGDFSLFITDKSGTGKVVTVHVNAASQVSGAILTLTPDSLDIAKDSSKRVSIVGGTPDYTTRIEGELKGVTASIAKGASGAQEAMIQAAKDASGKGEVRVRDSQGTEKGIKVTVK